MNLTVKNFFCHCNSFIHTSKTLLVCFIFLFSIKIKGQSLNLIDSIYQYVYPEGRYNWLRLDFYSFEFNPGIHYTFQNSMLEIKYRAAQIKRVDPILFSDNLRIGREDFLEIHNPFKIWIAANVRL